MFASLLQTVAHRPYVFAFLAAFLVIGTLNRGAARTWLLLGVGYAIAFVSEWSSIRWGVPYGLYHYLYDAMEGELILAGVPVWDSLSYTFLAYASYETACYLGWRRKVTGAAFLMMWADVIIDPVALRGERWFLGRIYEYPEGGLFFGVPLSNYVGWFLVGWAIVWSWQRLAGRLVTSAPPLRAPLLGPLFYYGILAFIVTVAAFIGEPAIVGAACLLHAPIVVALVRRWSVGRSPRAGGPVPPIPS